MRRPQGASLEEILSTSKHIAVLEDLVDVNNVGAVFRSAAALNVDAVILTAKCADNLSRRVLRVSMGTVLNVPWTRLDEETTSLDLIKKLKAHSFTTCALALTDSAVPLNKELVKGKKAALFFGSEGYGLDKKTIKACDITTIIPCLIRWTRLMLLRHLPWHFGNFLLDNLSRKPLHTAQKTATYESELPPISWTREIGVSSKHTKIG